MPVGSVLCDALVARTATPQCPAHHHRHGGADPRRCAPAARNGGSGSLMLPFSRVAIIGLGLIGSSLARAIKAQMPTVRVTGHDASAEVRSEEHTSELQSLMRNSYAVFCLKKKKRI